MPVHSKTESSNHEIIMAVVQEGLLYAMKTMM
ncbi:unnamed protein product [Taenia asiatica]|uniref:Transposase n=1 Tax=Taenia asiatica TaxID=60517 RepID=A0A0R3WH86_TAEAS|nr:unnamed protein product [Taenia asiatica]